MNRINAGTPGTVARAGDFLPTAYARRLARVLILKAAVSGRLSWCVALPLINRIGGCSMTATLLDQVNTARDGAARLEGLRQGLLQVAQHPAPAFGVHHQSGGFAPRLTHIHTPNLSEV